MTPRTREELPRLAHGRDERLAGARHHDLEEPVLEPLRVDSNGLTVGLEQPSLLPAFDVEAKIAVSPGERAKRERGRPVEPIDERAIDDTVLHALAEETREAVLQAVGGVLPQEREQIAALARPRWRAQLLQVARVQPRHDLRQEMVLRAIPRHAVERTHDD